MADGDLTSPSIYSEADVSSYEDNVSALVQEIKDHIQDPSFTDAKVLGILNRGLREIATVLSTSNVWLPSLETMGEVVARSDSLACRLPADFMGNLFSCVDTTNGQMLQIVKWHQMQVMMADGLPGRLHSVCVHANALRYWHEPDINARLRLYYYKMPPKLLMTTRITSIPPEMSSSLIVTYGLMKCYSEIETEQNDGKANTKFFQAQYADELATVMRSVGAYPVPIETCFDVMEAALW